MAPTTKMSPTFKVPRCTSTVASGPRPLSSLASTTVPSAWRFGFGLELEQFGLEVDRLQQPSRLVFLSAGNLHVLDVAAHILDDDLVLQELLADLLCIGARACRSC
jgi:hypothetical protein